MGGCNKKVSATCGKRYNAKCIDYEGSLHNNTDLDDCDCHNVEEVIEDINSELNEINSEIDVTEINSDCLTFETNENGEVAINEVVIKVVQKLDELCPTTEEDSDCPPIFEVDITCLGLDLSCLTDPCGEQITTLKGLLQALITNTCNNNA
jgi:hypothetical protein